MGGRGRYWVGWNNTQMWVVRVGGRVGFGGGGKGGGPVVPRYSETGVPDSTRRNEN